MTGPQGAYKRQGFGGVWRWAKGHGIKRWLRAKHWAQRRRQQLKDPQGYKKAILAYEKKIKAIRRRTDKHHDDTSGKIVTFDGLPCPKWIAKILQEARASGIWKGSLISGYRTPEHSEQICIDMCGAPTCPGKCAGRNTNHACPPTNTCGYPEGAGDVTDPEGLEAFCRSHHKPLKGDGVVLPFDVNHFSHAGN